MVGKAKEYFDIWEAEFKEEGGDRGFGKILDKVGDYPRKAKLESNTMNKHNDDDMDTGEVKKKEEATNTEEANNTWWEEYINSIAKGKGKGK